MFPDALATEDSSNSGSKKKKIVTKTTVTSDGGSSGRRKEKKTKGDVNVNDMNLEESMVTGKDNSINSSNGSKKTKVAGVGEGSVNEWTKSKLKNGLCLL